MTFTLRTPLLLAASALALGACAEDGADDGGSVVCAGGKCDAPTDPAQFACKNVVDESGRGRPNVLAELNDPISVFVLRGGSGCPTSFKDTVKKLRDEDKTGCETGTGAGMSTRFVTETGQVDGGKKLQGFRTVVSRRCNGRQEFELLASLFGVGADGRLPGNAEFMAFDAETKEFNYYEITNGRWHFFGSSSDFVEKGAGGGDERRCAACHTGGGLVMKELDVPWVHWTGHFQTPGTTKIIDANKDDLGSESSGANMESLTNQGNREWTKTRVTNALNPERSSVAALLRPLFCTVEHNLDNGTDFDSSPFTGIPVDFLIDPAFKSFGSIGVKADIYEAARAAAGLAVPGLGVGDTIFKFTFVERSKADIMYVDELENRGIVDDDFIKDVLAVDFTRPVFSDARCSLLDFAPTFEQLESPMPPGGTEGGSEESGGEEESSGGGETTGAGESTGGGETTGGGAGAGDCCTADESRQGCENDTIEMCTCAADSFCCETSWDATCVMVATEQCNAMCGTNVVADDELGFAGEVAPKAAVTAADIRAAFIANLEQANPAAGTPAAELLANLKAEGDAKAHTDRANAFLKACEDRDERAMMDDAFKILQWQRDVAYSTRVMEFEQTMAETKLEVESSTHLDPATCTVVE